jgi:hypothetical protein
MLAGAPSLRWRTDSARRLILTGCWPGIVLYRWFAGTQNGGVSSIARCA